MRSVVLGFGLLVCGLAACGGRAVGTPDGEDPDGSEQEPDGSEEPTPGSDDFSDETQLGECKLGELQYEATGDCAWVADDRCYEARAMACNCVCPRQRDSQCTSGFDSGPNGRVRVDCY